MKYLILLGLISSITLPDTCTSTGVVALTIDEGPSAYTDSILDILDKKGVPATFHFNPSIVGSEFQGIYDRVEDEGHEIGFRSSPKRAYTDDQPYEDVEEDLDQQLKFMQSRTSKDIKYARAPKNGDLPVQNVYNYFVKRKIIQTSYSLCPHDNPDEDPVDRIRDFLGPNNYKHDSFIIQLYEQRLEQDGNLSEIIDAIKEYNYEIVTLSSCLDGYEPGKPVTKSKSGRLTSSCSKMVFPQFIPLLMHYLIY
ncbi:uncharacterized protein VICG_00186 [Vittaforma corneae ATCC 50505]|uniref:NodB homology domain-containing protein n=1 Tax=Vittaforma corneae (strain ATCC 50505) TaxID=993615 RepID=L2GPV4_VITCO|nr:uncharacterized protein VICG_00186 [Vittaforma corneae ATCC 50505]ELA42871.1 hypothetical protein VICG_00186 [Vittaforma corneae ATCC 50505]